MRWLFIFLGIASLCSSVDRAQAQATPPPPLAPGPLLKRAPNFSQWLISVKSGPADASAASDQKVKYDSRTLVTKTGAIRYEITVDGSGVRQSDRWCEGNTQTSIYPGVKDPVVRVQGATVSWNGAAGGFTDYTKTDFPGFEWISKRNYTGVQSFAGVPCIVFREDSPDSGGAPAPAANPAATGGPPAIPTTGKTAYIMTDPGKPDDRLPIMLQEDNVTTYYQWRPAPTAMLTVPANVQAALDVLQARLQLASHRQASP